LRPDNASLKVRLRQIGLVPQWSHPFLRFGLGFRVFREPVGFPPRWCPESEIRSSLIFGSGRISESKNTGNVLIPVVVWF
jgi:hypothetical protein